MRHGSIMLCVAITLTIATSFRAAWALSPGGLTIGGADATIACGGTSKYLFRTVKPMKPVTCVTIAGGTSCQVTVKLYDCNLQELSSSTVGYEESEIWCVPNLCTATAITGSGAGYTTLSYQINEVVK